MMGLICNEHVKIYRRARTWIFFAAITAIAILGAALKHHTAVQLHDKETVWMFMDSMGRAVYLVIVFASIVAGDIVGGEFAGGTVKLLLIRPHRRWKILLSKYLSVLSFSFTLLVFTVFVAWLVGGLVFGFSGAGEPYLLSYGGHTVSIPASSESVRTYAYLAIPLLLTSTLAFMISTLFRSSVVAIALSVFLVLFGPVITEVLRSYAWDRFVLFANWNLAPYFENDMSPLPNMTLSFSIIVLIVYYVVFLAISWLSFTKRDVSA